MARRPGPNALMCPAKCGRRRRVGLFLCTVCWRALPKRNQVELSRTWRGAQARLSDDVAWSDWQRARRVALVALRKKVGHQAVSTSGA